jgi:hypothetical protein
VKRHLAVWLILAAFLFGLFVGRAFPRQPRLPIHANVDNVEVCKRMIGRYYYYEPTGDIVRVDGVTQEGDIKVSSLVGGLQADVSCLYLEEQQHPLAPGATQTE